MSATITEPEQPWVMYEAEYFPTPTTPWQRAQAEQWALERQARAVEREKAEQRALRAERRQDMLTESGEMWSWARGLPHDPSSPFANIPSPDAQQDMYEAALAAEERRNARRALEEAGISPSLLKSALPEPPANVPNLPTPDPELLADAAAERARRRTIRAGIRHKIARVLRGPIAPTVASRSAAAVEYEAAVAELDGREITRTYDARGGWF